MSTKVTPKESSGLPLRGIAMIILAVAVLLLAWGVYSMTSSGSSEIIAGENTSAESDSVARSVLPGQPAKPAQPAEQAPAQQSNKPAPAEASAPAAAPVPQQAAPAAPAAPAVDPAEVTATKVHALNNSTVQGLAKRVTDDIKEAGFKNVESGNFPHEILPASAVFFTPGNAIEQEAANKLATQLEIKAQPRLDSMKDQPAGVILVITQDLNR